MAIGRSSTAITLILGLVLLGGALLMLGALSQIELTLPSWEPAQQEHPPLPRPHEPVPPREAEHFTANGRVEMAAQARAIIADPGSRCNYYECAGNSSVMRSCTMTDAAGNVIYAMQWMWYSTEAGAWMEGSAWVQDDPDKAERYLRNQGCIE